MDTERLGRSRFLNAFFKLSGRAMESRLRERLFDPLRTLEGAGLRPGQTVLEVGCGTGFFTLPAARMIGDGGHLIAMDPMSGFVDRVRDKVREAGLRNVEVVRRDALKTGSATATVDVVLALGVLPYPSLPLDRLLPEMHRVLKPDGTMAVWLFPITFGVPRAILQSGLFSHPSQKNGVYTFRRSEATGSPLHRPGPT
ncbi:MAG: class I SAM-dependent methyltransferase [Alphaproteobacteria bacterium]|jgi:demethylmenaquinone methyltransferase/2-methoxy-6-polyprenyl-1,4-benzoquinol methylase|nr:class I SAM-dependent methyltransferase [Alphaproteobacteria bacterium]